MANTRAKDSGVTLIEIMVVLVLIGISASVVSLALPNTSSSRSFMQEANLLESRLNLAAERSVIEGRSFRMQWTAGAYAFSEMSQGEWQPSGSETLPAEHIFGVEAALADQNGARSGEIVIEPDLLPPPSGSVELILGNGTLRRSVVFDGLSARSGEEI